MQGDSNIDKKFEISEMYRQHYSPTYSEKHTNSKMSFRKCANDL